MKILLVMDPGILVPPKGYGGIERIVALLAAEYHRLGHSVDVLATNGSHVAGCTMYSIGPEGFPPGKKVMNRAVLTAWIFIWKNRKKYDLIQNFGRLLYLLPVLNNHVKKIMCYQREITRSNIEAFNFLPNKNIFFSGCSTDLVKRANPPGKWTAVHNAIDSSQFIPTDYLPEDAPLIFLGRIERIKGCHIAIRVARHTGKRLIVAGNISQLPEEIEYFENEIKPEIDGIQIVYVGELNDKQKCEWLGKAQALLMPIEWNEPFGIVMIEAMACGTPVIAFNKGSVEEVIDEGITGFKVGSEDEMKDAISEISAINRIVCRRQAEKRFDVRVIAAEYLQL